MDFVDAPANSDQDSFAEEKEGGRGHPEKCRVAQYDGSTSRNERQACDHEGREGGHAEEGDREQYGQVGAQGASKLPGGQQGGEEHEGGQRGADGIHERRRIGQARELHDGVVQRPFAYGRSERYISATFREASQTDLL